MKVKIKYFGMIAEKIGSEYESIDLDVDGKYNLRTFFENKYPQIKSVNYKIAVNQQISDFLEKKEKDVEIALLPPFAGG